MLHTTVKTRIVRIGNSQGIRIPKLVLEHLGFTKEVEMEILSDQLILRSSAAPRRDWEDRFQAMAAAGDDQLLDGESVSLSEWDDKEWVW